MHSATAASSVLLVSCYELGQQPLSIATPLAYLRRRGIDATPYDLSLQRIPDEAVRRAEVIAIAVPMHTALKIGLRFAARARELNREVRLVFFGHYASLNAELLVDSGADAALGGECDDALAAWIGQALDLSRTEPWTPGPFLERPDYPAPARSQLPPLDRYVHLENGSGPHRVVGSVQASRGCRHHCRHCPLPPVYEGRFFVVARQTVLEDIRGLVAEGAEHINFADPDFLNGPRHAFELVRAMSDEHPQLTFDFTAKVEHLLRHRDRLPELRRRGCAFIVSAVESLSDDVLRELDKGHTAADAKRALSLARDAGIPLKPTFVAFTPWTSMHDYRELFQWVIDEELFEDVEPIQMALRLLVPPGSLLADHPGLVPHLGELDREGLTHRWTHPDPAMDRLQLEAMRAVDSAAREGWDRRETFEVLATLAGITLPSGIEARPTPRLTEAWFC